MVADDTGRLPGGNQGGEVNVPDRRRPAGKGRLNDFTAPTAIGHRGPVTATPPDRDVLRERTTSLAAQVERAVLRDNLAGSVHDRGHGPGRCLLLFTDNDLGAASFARLTNP